MAGAYDVLIKPVNHDMLNMALRRAANTHALRSGDHRAAKEDSVVIVQGLRTNATIERVKQLFAPIGKVVWCRLVVDSNASSFAYVELDSSFAAKQAVNQLSGRTVLGDPLTVSICSDTMERRVHDVS